MSKPTPIIHTRVPADLQSVFTRANRGEVVDVPAESLCRNWGEKARRESTKIKKSTSFPDLMEVEITSPRSLLSNVQVPSRFSVSIECGDHYSDISSHCSTDHTTTFEHLDVLQGKTAIFSRWDAECSPRKGDIKLPPFRRQKSSSRWEFKTAEGGSGVPKMPTRH